MEIGLPVPLVVLALGAIALLGGFEVIHLSRRARRRKVIPKPTVAPRPQRQVVLRPPTVQTPPPSPREADPGDAVRTIILFTDMVKNMSAAQSAAEVPSVLLRALGNLIGVACAAYFEYDPQENLLRLVEARELPPEVVGTLTFPLGHGKVGYAAEKAIVMEDRDFEWEGPEERARIMALPSGGVPTAFLAPMFHQGRLFGVVAVGEPTDRSPHLKKLLSAIADLAAIALNNARLVGGYAHRADTDALTGLYSRGYLTRRLAEEVVRCQNYGDPLSVLMLDVDNFKHYNDTNGHPAGDQVLRLVAEALKKNFRKTDFVARYGGEEFSVVMSGLRKVQAHALAERLRAHIEGRDFPHGEKQPLGRVTISAGVASFPQDATTGEELISAADRALYEAKRSGRNRVVLYQAPELSSEEDLLEPAGPSGRSQELEAFLASQAEPAPCGEATVIERDRVAPAPTHDPPDPVAPAPPRRGWVP